MECVKVFSVLNAAERLCVLTVNSLTYIRDRTKLEGGFANLLSCDQFMYLVPFLSSYISLKTFGVTTEWGVVYGSI